jgi:hypothetical protein
MGAPRKVFADLGPIFFIHEYRLHLTLIGNSNAEVMRDVITDTGFARARSAANQ